MGVVKRRTSWLRVPDLGTISKFAFFSIFRAPFWFQMESLFASSFLPPKPVLSAPSGKTTP